jgi:hypothetical protein
VHHYQAAMRRQGGVVMTDARQTPDEPDTPAEAADRENRSDSVARRAYERFQMRGGEHGHDQEDWFEAERELSERNTPDE